MTKLRRKAKLNCVYIYIYLICNVMSCWMLTFWKVPAKKMSGFFCPEMPPGSQHPGNNSFCCVIGVPRWIQEKIEKIEWSGIQSASGMVHFSTFNSTILSNYLGPFRDDHDYPTRWCWWKSNSTKWYGRLPRCLSARFLTCSGTETNC